MKVDSRLAPRIAAVLAAQLFAAMYLVTALPRVFYPYDLDFIEDGMLMEALRFARGQPVFMPPNADFDPHVYMPLYSWLGGWLFKLAGPGYVPLRLLSFGATVGSASLIYWIARRESGLRWVGLAGAGLFLGGYRISGFWYELARVDALFVVLALGGLALGIYSGRSTWRLVLSAVALALAFFGKQTGLLFGVGLAVYLLITLGGRAWLFALTYGALIAVPLMALNTLTGGWFFIHIFARAADDPVEIGRVIRYAGPELFGLMAGLSVTTVIAGVIGLRRAGLRLVREQPWLIAIGMAAVISGTGRASVGGNVNNLMPVYALLCLAPALLVRAWGPQPVARGASGPPPPSPPPSPSPAPACGGWGAVERGEGWPQAGEGGEARDWLIGAAILIQFALGVYYPPRYIPTAEMRRAGARLIERIASVDGPVLVMMHPYYALLAGKEPAAQIATLWYVRARGALPLPDDFVRRMRGRHYAAIISDESSFETEPDLAGLIAANYVRAETLDPGDAPPTTTGVVVRPRVIYLPKQP